MRASRISPSLRPNVPRLRSGRTNRGMRPGLGIGCLDPLPRLARRTARAHAAVGADRQDDQAAARRARVEGVLPVPQREDAELHRQRRQGLLPLLRLRRARRCDPLDDRSARPALHRCGQGTRAGRRARRPRAGSPRARTGRARLGAARRHGQAAAWYVEQLGRAEGASARAYLAQARHLGSAGAQLPYRARPREPHRAALGAQGASATRCSSSAGC